MKAKLIKVDNGWVLMVDNVMYATDNDKLSLKNCQAIERGYDLDELAREEAEKLYNKSEHEDYSIWEYLVSEEVESIKLGLQIALELLGDKKYSEEDVISMIEKSRETGLTAEYLILTNQQTEWDVEIEMESILENGYKNQPANTIGFVAEYKSVPKLDADGCLILKRI